MSMSEPTPSCTEVGSALPPARDADANAANHPTNVRDALAEAVQTVGSSAEAGIDPTRFESFEALALLLGMACKAQRARLKGNIDIALAAERRVERLYKTLPSAWRW